ncbi:MAG TPA: glycosyltransferase family 2 protein [Acidimicrobiales bacterium]
MTVSAVVLSYRPDNWLDACLKSVSDQVDQLVVVDNGSDRAEASTIATKYNATVIGLRSNVGFAAGVNLGVSRSSGDVIALLNDDAFPHPGWINQSLQVVKGADVAAVVPKVLRRGLYREVILEDRHDAPADHRSLGRMLRSVTAAGVESLDRLLGAGIHSLEQGDDPLTPKWRWTVPGAPFYVPVATPEDEVLINGDPARPGPVCRLLNKAGGYMKSDGVLGDIGDGTPDDGRWDTPSEPFFASATAMVMRREVFDEIGGLAEPFFAYYEDADWCWRARLRGMRVLYEPHAKVEHLHSATSGGSALFVNRLATRNRLLTLLRNAPFKIPAELAINAFRDLGDARARVDLVEKLPWAIGSRLKSSRSWKVSPDEIWRRWADADTTWDAGPAREGISI